jgi:protein-disulfide isomerase
MKVQSAFLLFSAFTVRLLVAASAPPPPDLQSYLERSFASCPDRKIDIQRLPDAPRGFDRYKAQMSSSAKECGRQAEALLSLPTKQLLFGNVFPLPADPRPLKVRLVDLARRLLRKSARVSVGAAIEDGLRPVTFLTEGKVGPFRLSGYVDASGSFFIVGRRGHLNVDPRQSLLAALPPNAGVHRGTLGGAIRIVEISDLECPTCKQAHELLNTLTQKNLGRISYTRIDLPIFDIHDWSLSAALAARAIERVAPNHYWEFVDYIFQSQAAIKPNVLETVIGDFLEGHDINRQKFDAIYKSQAERAALIHQIERLFDIDIATTPTFLVNGQEIFYGYQGSYLKQHLENLLNNSR